MLNSSIAYPDFFGKDFASKENSAIPWKSQLHFCCCFVLFLEKGFKTMILPFQKEKGAIKRRNQRLEGRSFPAGTAGWGAE